MSSTRPAIVGPSRRRSLRPARCVLAAALAGLGFGVAGGAEALDWSKSKPVEVMLFYPGQGSWEWVMTAKDHGGATKFREGKNCKSCHEGEQTDMGRLIVGGEKLEPKPIKGKPGAVKMQVSTAHDGQRLYLRLQWRAAAPSGVRMNPDYAARVAVMITDGQVKEAARAGCWASCHDDASGMASAAPGTKIGKYLGNSRSRLGRSGGGENFKPAAAIAQLLAKGAFVEYWQAKLNPGRPAQAVSGWILDRRHQHPKPAITANATFQGGLWTVELSRPLKATGAGQKDLLPGTTYAVGFALHDDYSDHRYHHVSFEQTLILDQGAADFVVKRN